MALPPKFYQVLVSIFAALGSFLYGYDLTIVAEVISSQSFLNQFTPSTAQLGLVASLLTAGAFVGAAIAGSCSNYLGRRKTILLAGIFFCLGAALQTGAANYSYIIAGRFIAGIGIGIFTMIIPIYQAELVHPDIRGFVISLQQLMLGIGGICGSWISYGTFVGFDDNRQWRVPLGIQIIPAAVVSILIFLFPESPRWLISKDRHEEGLKTLAKLHSRGDLTDSWIQAEYEQIKTQVAEEKSRKIRSIPELFSTRANQRRIVLACAMQAATQMTGISAIQYYSVDIFKQIGIDSTFTLRAQAINSVIGFIGELLTAAFVDYVGRRSLVIGGSLAMCGTYVVSTILLALFPPSNTNSGAHWGFIIMTWVFNFCFGTMGTLSWVLPAEIFDTRTRSYGVALGVMTSFAFNTMIGQVTPIGLKSSGWRFYLLFVVTNFTNALFFWSFLPETKKVPLEEMQDLFTETPYFVGWRDSGKTKTRQITVLAEDIEKTGPQDEVVQTQVEYASKTG